MSGRVTWSRLRVGRGRGKRRVRSCPFHRRSNAPRSACLTRPVLTGGFFADGMARIQEAVMTDKPNFVLVPDDACRWRPHGHRPKGCWRGYGRDLGHYGCCHGAAAGADPVRATGGNEHAEPATTDIRRGRHRVSRAGLGRRPAGDGCAVQGAAGRTGRGACRAWRLTRAHLYRLHHRRRHAARPCRRSVVQGRADPAAADPLDQPEAAGGAGGRLYRRCV